MPLDYYLNIAASGLLNGLVYGLAALGLSVIFGVVRVVNFAHGEMMVAGMYGAVLLAGFIGLDPILSAPVIALALFAFGWGLQRRLVNRFVEQPEHMQFILLLGIATIILNAMLMLFGPDSRNVQVPYGFDTVEVGPLLLDAVRLRAGAAAIVVAAALFAFFRFCLLAFCCFCFLLDFLFAFLWFFLFAFDFLWWRFFLLAFFFLFPRFASIADGSQK